MPLLRRVPLHHRLCASTRQTGLRRHSKCAPAAVSSDANRRATNRSRQKKAANSPARGSSKIFSVSSAAAPVLLLSVRWYCYPPVFGEEAFFRCAFPPSLLRKPALIQPNPSPQAAKPPVVLFPLGMVFLHRHNSLPSASLPHSRTVYCIRPPDPDMDGCFAASVCGAACWTVLTGCAASGRLCALDCLTHYL